VQSGAFDKVDQIERFKSALYGPLGAVGDQYFWATIKPTAVILAVAGIAIFEPLWLKLIFLALLLILYNVPHLMVRIKGQYYGYRKGFQIYRDIFIERFDKSRRFYKILGVVFLGSCIAFISFSHVNRDGLHLLIFISSILLTYQLRIKQKSFFIIVLLPVTLALIIGILVGII
ncbi:MAG: hypothetical protein GF313_15465, partial [Caldithrix sp.]|nr:hypothetical protein [Caldithrix sp.]